MREVLGGCAERERRAAALGGRLLAVEGQRPLKEDDVRVTTAFKRLLRLPGASVIDVSFTAEGVIVTVRLRRRRRVCAACGQTGRRLRDPRPPRQALAPPRSRRQSLRDRVRAAAAALPHLRRAAGAGAVGAPGRRAHARLRGRRRVAGPADGQDADHRAAADRLGHGRADRRARRRRPPRRAPPRRAWSASASTRSAIAAITAT